MAIEKLAGIEVPERVKVIRVMMSEMFRILSHFAILWYFRPRHWFAITDILYVCGQGKTVWHC